MRVENNYLYPKMSLFFFFIQQETGKDLSSMTQNRDPHPIPKEIWFLVDHLYRHGLKQAHLFEHPGLHSELLLIRNWLDNGSPDPLRILFYHKLIIKELDGLTNLPSRLLYPELFI